MTAKEQRIVLLRSYIKARRVFPGVAVYAEQHAINCLQNLGGLAGSWRTDYSECTYSQPQLVSGRLIDFSTVAKARAFYEYCEAMEAAA